MEEKELAEIYEKIRKIIFKEKPMTFSEINWILRALQIEMEQDFVRKNKL